MESLAKELRDGLDEIRAAVAGQADGQTETVGRTQAQDKDGAGRSETRAAPPVAGLGSKKPFRERRLDPEIVTVEPDDDDRRGLRRCVAAGRGVARAAGRAPPPGREPVVAHDRRAAAHAGAGDAGGARADAAPGEAAPAGLRAQGTDQLALEGPGGHEGGVEEAEAAALGAPGPAPSGCGESRPRSRLRGRFPVGAASLPQESDMAACNFGADARKPRPGPSIRSDVRAIIESLSGFSSVSCLETWRIPVHRIRDRLHRIEPRSPNSRPGVRPEGLSLALPKVAPEDTFDSGWSASRASAPRTPWSECAPHPGSFLMPAAQPSRGWVAASTRADLRRISPVGRFNVLAAFPGGLSPLGRAASFSHRRLLRSTRCRAAGVFGTGTRIHRSQRQRQSAAPRR